MSDPVTQYLATIERELRSGEATEPTYYPALAALIQGLAPGTQATISPKHVVECGAPDIAISRSPGPLTIGYVEAKDIGRSLDEAENTEQLQRYRRLLPNLVLTNYLEFRWYVDAEQRSVARLGRIGNQGKLVRDRLGEVQVARLIQDFVAHRPPEISSPRDLAERLARFTQLIRGIIVTAFETGKESPLLRDLRKAFAAALIPDLDEPDRVGEFADMYAQTIAYGLFAAACNHRGPQGSFRRQGAAAEIPKTNPFLRKLFETITGADLDEEPYVRPVEDLVALLAHTDIGAVLQHFGRRTRREDPVVHFYETFLTAYDPRLKKLRGVYYTPEPVVSFIVRSVDHILRTRFGLREGLGDRTTISYEREEDPEPDRRRAKATAPRVLVLDPACGTGTFLYSVVDLIREQFRRRRDAGLWSGYVRQHLLPRLFGFELLMAPYAVAHLKLGMQLAALDMPENARRTWAYDFSGQERLHVYMTNTLEEAERRAEGLFGPLRVISDEANAAGWVKQDLPILVVMGNPPWANFGRMNRGEWITDLMSEWRPEGEKKWNPDDFMKFIRWGQWRIEQTGAGILAFITNHTYLDGLTHRRMRESLLRTFTDIYVLDLHGSTRYREKSPTGDEDENVFDIQQGAAISLFVREPGHGGSARVHYAELWGSRLDKYAELSEKDIGGVQWTTLDDVARKTCLGDFFFFAPKAFANVDEYCEGPSIRAIFPVGQNGVKTDRDELFVDLDRDALTDRMRTFYSDAGLDPEFREAFRVRDSSSYDLLDRRARTTFDPAYIKPFVYRAFDSRWLYYSPRLTSRAAWDIMAHMLAAENLALCTSRQVLEEFRHAFVARGLTNINVIDTAGKFGSGPAFPLYVYGPPGGQTGAQREFLDPHPWPKSSNGRRPNLAPGVVEAISNRLGLDFVLDGAGDLRKSFGPEDVFHYIYAFLHSRGYRERYAEFLRIDFPRIPLTSCLGLFRRLAHLGADLVALHLLDDAYPLASWARAGRPSPLATPIASYPVPGDNTVETSYPRYFEPGQPDPVSHKPLGQHRIYLNKDHPQTGKRAQFFECIPREVWEFRIGGYQVCERWLKDRQHRQLTYEDLTHYQRVLVAVQETLRRIAEIEDAIQQHGGWPIR